MNQENACEWLSREVSDHLAMGPMGLYELLWLLNGSSHVLTEGEAIELSVHVVKKIVADGAADLYVIRWPGGQVVDGPLPPSRITTDAALWGEGPEKTFLALIVSEVADDSSTE